MKNTEFVFVILTYRNTEDLSDVINSVKMMYERYEKEIIVVNSYYDQNTKDEVETIAQREECIFINVENKGYGYGNNCGIAYANQKFVYQYLVIVNPDTQVLQNDFDYKLYMDKSVVIAPEIRNLRGKRQNPYWCIKNSFSEWLVYIGYKNNRKILVYMGIGINKILRIAFNLFLRKKRRKIFAAHGSFLIFSKKAISTLQTVFDENMFLFAEENLLAHTLEKANIDVFYVDEIKILHKEDGSMRIAKIDVGSEIKKSIVYYYEKLKGKDFV